MINAVELSLAVLVLLLISSFAKTSFDVFGYSTEMKRDELYIIYLWSYYITNILFISSCDYIVLSSKFLGSVAMSLWQ